MKVQARTKEKPDAVFVEYDIPEELQGLVSTFGEAVVKTAARGAIVISLQSFMRRLIEKGKSPEEIQNEVNGWKPDTRTVVKQTAYEKVTSSLDKLSPEERRELLETLRSQQEGQAQAA